MNRDLNELERRCGYTFKKDKDLFHRALTHSSYANEHKKDKAVCNERLEFWETRFWKWFPVIFCTINTGETGRRTLKIRASLVCEPTLAYCAADLELGSYLLLGKGEEATGGRERNSVVSDAMEALIGSIYLDGGFANAKEFIHRFILNDIEHKQLFYDSKTILQEMIRQLQGHIWNTRSCGKRDRIITKVFEVRALSGGEELGRGTGGTKKAAEAVAAYHGILKLRGKNVFKEH